MSLFDVIFLALGVSLDSFAICVCKGISAKHSFFLALKCAICFSLFQILMPLLGCFLGQTFEPYIDKFDHYIIFAILFFLGINMFKEAFSNSEKEEKNGFFSILFLAFFSSFDSFGMGISLGLFESSTVFPIILIGSLTLIFSFAGVYVGKFFGKKHKKIACIFGGIVLIVLAFKILISHLL